jgi:hypothetical protein
MSVLTFSSNNFDVTRRKCCGRTYRRDWENNWSVKLFICQPGRVCLRLSARTDKEKLESYSEKRKPINAIIHDIIVGLTKMNHWGCR